MVFLKTKLHVFDNTGITLVKCIHVPEIRSGCATLGSLVVVVPQKKQINKPVEKLDLVLKNKVFWGILVTSKKQKKRKAGYHICFEKNGVLLLNKDLNLIARRVTGPVCNEVLRYVFMREVKALKRTI